MSCMSARRCVVREVEELGPLTQRLLCALTVLPGASALTRERRRPLNCGGVFHGQVKYDAKSSYRSISLPSKASA